MTIRYGVGDHLGEPGGAVNVASAPANGETHIPRASRPFESPMTLAVRNSRPTVAANPSLVAAGADEAKADTAQRVAADPSVIDAERHPLYGHGVHRHVSSLSHVPASEPGHLPTEDAPYEAPPGGLGKGLLTGGVSSEQTRLGRLSRWQEQR